MVYHPESSAIAEEALGGADMVGPAGTEPNLQRQREKTLRLALAMRGGVSLAVWIGGAVAEIDLFRRACNEMDIGDDPTGQRHVRADVYRELIAKTRYKRVEIDILAGASAGGLNAVLYGLAQSCNRVMDSIVHDTWISDGGIWELLRPTGFGRVPSILQGDERLFTVIRDALGSVAAENTPLESQDPDRQTDTPDAPDTVAAQTITVELAATLLDDRSNPDRANRARFSFAKTAGSLQSGYSTIPGPMSQPATEREVWERGVTLDRMALAARATSSFPGAFEPAEVLSVSSGMCVPGTNAPLPPDYLRPPRTGVNMARAFLYARAQGANCPEPFNVIDGGVFDNIPIDRAIRAIRRAPATQPCERVLIYLDPEPPTAAKPDVSTGSGVSAVSWIPVIRRSLTLKQRDETEGDELSLVREHNDSVMETRGRLEALAAALRARSGSTDELPWGRRLFGRVAFNRGQFVHTLISDEAYLQCRIAADGPRLGRLLTDPTSELCYPPREAADYVPLAATEAVDIRSRLIDAYSSPLYWDLATDVAAMLDWVRVLLAWVHALEDITNDFLERCQETTADDAFPDPARDAIGQLTRRLKPRLYRWLTVLTEARYRTVDQVLAEPLRREHREAGRNYPWPIQLHISRNKQRALRLTPELEALLGQEAESTGSDQKFYELLSAHDQFCSPGTVSEDFSTLVARSLNEILDDIRSESRTVAQSLARKYDALTIHRDRPTIPKWLAYWSESVYPHLYRQPFFYPKAADISPKPMRIEQLSRLFAITGIPDTASTIDYGRITSRERSHIPLPVLKQSAKAEQLSRWLRRLPKSDAALMPVLARDPLRLESGDKLAGNALSRFGGFFLWRWRENDWQWGRLDGAAGIVKIVERTSTNVPRHGESQCRKELTQRLQQSLMWESAGISASPDGKTDTEEPGPSGTVPVAAEAAGGDSFDQISSHYRFALASRIVPLVYRASWPTRSSPISLDGAASRMVNVILRPLAVPAPLIADPLRLALALVVILLSSSLLGVSGTGTFWRGFVVVFFVVAAGAIAIRTAKAARSWRSLKRRLDRLHVNHSELHIKSEWVDPILGPAKNCWYRRLSWVLVVVTVAVPWLLGALDSAEQGSPPCTIEAFVASAAAVLGLQHWLNQHAYKVVSPKKSAADRQMDNATPFGDRSRSWAKIQTRVPRVVLTISAAAGAVIVVVASGRVVSSPDAIPPWLHGWDDVSSKVLIASAAVALLTAISLWGWAQNRWSAIATVAGAVVGGFAQWGLDGQWGPSADSGWWDLLPVFVWMVGLGSVVAWLPCRPERYGEPARPHVTGVC